MRDRDKSAEIIRKCGAETTVMFGERKCPFRDKAIDILRSARNGSLLRAKRQSPCIKTLECLDLLECPIIN
jgi:hypothetical protein